MKKRGNILLNAMLALTITSVVFISMARHNDQIHKFETIVFEQEVPLTYVDYTLELFFEDMNEHFEYFSTGDNVTDYRPSSFRETILSRLEGLTGFSYISDDVTDPNVSQLTNFGHILNNGGYEIPGTDIYTLGIDLPEFTGTFEMKLDYIMKWQYKWPDDYKEHRRLCNTGDQYYCDLTEDTANYDLEYDFTENSAITLTETN